MSTAYSPKIVTDGLALCLDAGNIKSYPQSGTNWVDLSGNRHDVTLSGTISFDSGTISATATNAYGVGPATTAIIPTGTTGTTMEIWMKYTTTNLNQYVFQTKRDLTGTSTWAGIRLNPLSTNTRIAIFRRNAANTAHPSFDTADGFNDGMWHHVVGAFSSTTRRGYVDGVLVGEDSDGIEVLSTATAVITFFGTSTATNNPYLGDLAVAKLYNRYLTESEVLQNFNATKGRFGK